MQIWYNTLCLLMLSGQFYEKWVSVWERNIKLLLETVTYIATTETVTCINAAETSNCIVARERVTYIIATKRSTNIDVAESTTNITAIEPQKLHNCNRCWHLHNCYIKYQLHSSNRNCLLQIWLQKLSQKWCQSETLLVIIKKFSEWVRTKFKAK